MRKRAIIRFLDNGKAVSLECDIASGPNDDLKRATFTAAGPEQYSIEGYESFQYLTMQPFSFPTIGNGTLEVENGGRFGVANGATAQDHTMFLQPE
jgi:hypothetical protein